MERDVMTVEEIKAKLPEANIYAIRADMAYLVVVARSQVNRQVVETFAVGLDAASLGAVVIVVDDPATAVRLLEVKR